MRECGDERRERAGEKSQRHSIDDIDIGPRYHDRGHGDSRPLSTIEPHVIPAPACTDTLAGTPARPKQMLKERLMLERTQGMPLGCGAWESQFIPNLPKGPSRRS